MTELRKVTEIFYTRYTGLVSLFTKKMENMSLETSVDLKYKAVEDFQIFAITVCM